MAQSAPAVVIDLNEFRQRRERQRTTPQPATVQQPAAWGMIWVMVPMWYWVAG